MRHPFAALLSIALPALLSAQSSPPAAHVQDVADVPIAFTNATLHIDARTTVPRATLVVQGGRVVAAGDRVTIPPGAAVRDMQGLHLWPALVEPYSDLGLPPTPSDQRKGEVKAARHWNGALRADAQAHLLLQHDAERSDALRRQGFATVIAHRMDGIARGTSAAVLLNDEPPRKAVLQPDVAGHFSLRRGSSPDPYPRSQMGAIALVRQALLDARWYAGQPRPKETDAVLDALARQLEDRLVAEAGDRNELLRWANIMKEFRLSAIIKGNGDEYARLAAIKATGMPLLVPFAPPPAYDVDDPFDALEVSYARLKHWELAPFNAMMLDTARVPFALTTHGHKDLKDVWKDLRRLVACGLDSARAIELLTTEPARLFGLEDRVGALRPGMVANLLVTSHHLLHARNTIHETWVQGRRFLIDDPEAPALQGTYTLNLEGELWQLKVGGPREKPDVKVRRENEPDSLAVKARFDRQGTAVTIHFAPKDKPQDLVRLNGALHGGGGLWAGQGQRPGGQWFTWSAVRAADDRSAAPRDTSSTAKPPTPPGPITHPLVGHGWITPPQQETVLFRKATVWTNTDRGILRGADVLVHQGRIVAVGEDLDPAAHFTGRTRPTVTEIDARGRHLTSGIIDEHSHIAISRGVNEGTQAVTAEVRIGDVTDPDDMNIYRNLAGGVTAVQQLHGSANPIGGQSSLIKLRWGHTADSMRIKDAPGHIKFALGENVKQSNWNVPEKRFPQTRMGVEQVFYEAFHRARAYDRQWREWNALKPRDRADLPPPRRDLELETLAEILNGTRHITCHSYVQSEIAMLVRVADSMGFRVNTFTHVLEGYKVAARLLRHGANASTFSDWWAYKFEVNDAIPFNAALMHAHGVNTGINSDDAEMSRRLNQEAAKTVKYGGVSEEEAWKMVTLNPARMLKLDHRMGSVEAGKDADLVLWSDHPLSIRARALQTWVDGVRYYDAERDARQRSWMAAERDRLVRAMIAAKAEGAPTRKARREHQHLWHCEDLGDGSEHDHEDHEDR